MDCAEGQQPRESDVTYLLEPAPVSVAATSGDAASASAVRDETLVVFCVDVSGSMNSYTQVGDGGAQVSRLRAAQAAVSKQLEALKQTYPDRRVALITFESDVHIYGDGVLLFAPRMTCRMIC